MGLPSSLSYEELLALVEEAEKRANEAENRAAEMTLNISFGEYLEACHRYISKPLAIETNRALTTKGSITSPTGRLCPTFLRHWSEFAREQQSLFDEVYRILHPSSSPPAQVFAPVLVIEDRGRRACRCPLVREAGLMTHQEAEVEEPVTEVISQLVRIPAAQCRFALGDGITIENHTNRFSEEPGQEQKQEFAPRRPSSYQNCIYRRKDDDRTLLYISEYRAAQKLPDSYLRAGLRPMNMWEEVVQRLTIPVDPSGKLKYNAERLSCAAVTQAFEYMIRL